jgi:hypothetical protein
MKPIKEKDLEVLSEIQENNRAILEKEKEINAKVKQIVEEEE